MESGGLPPGGVRFLAFPIRAPPSLALMLEPALMPLELDAPFATALGLVLAPLVDLMPAVLPLLELV